MVELVPMPDFVWTAVHARPRCEKVVAEYCNRLGFVCYLPLRRQVKRYQRRNVETWLPMFHGYLFAPLNAETRQRLLECHRITRFLECDLIQEQRLLAELQEVQRLESLSLTAEVTVKPELVAGKPVTIVDGPLRGLTGIIHRRQSVARVSVNVEMLGQSVSVDMDVGEVILETA